MRRIQYAPFFLLLCLLIIVLSLPLRLTEGVRAGWIQLFHRSWEGLTLTSREDREEINHLTLENQNLKAQLHTVREWLISEERLEELFMRYQGFSQEGISSEFFRRRAKHLATLLEGSYQALPGQVIFREPASWNSSVWINLGENDNRLAGCVIIAKNSPVLVGCHLVGLVETVTSSRSRVRLITDSELYLGVRAVRGVRYLAKGELHGSGQPLWRRRGLVLQGTGFNYDYPDEEGPARPLRSAEEILRVGDVLVTSGLDGVFPPDLLVAQVTKISSLREGVCSYDLEARALVSDMDALRHVSVLPPLKNN